MDINEGDGGGEDEDDTLPCIAWALLEVHSLLCAVRGHVRDCACGRPMSSRGRGRRDRKKKGGKEAEAEAEVRTKSDGKAKGRAEGGSVGEVDAVVVPVLRGRRSACCRFCRHLLKGQLVRGPGITATRQRAPS
jgi:hypothetical protein